MLCPSGTDGRVNTELPSRTLTSSRRRCPMLSPRLKLRRRSATRRKTTMTTPCPFLKADSPSPKKRRQRSDRRQPTAIPLRERWRPPNRTLFPPKRASFLSSTAESSGTTSSASSTRLSSRARISRAGAMTTKSCRSISMCRSLIRGRRCSPAIRRRTATAAHRSCR